MTINGKPIKPKLLGFRRIEDKWTKGFVFYFLYTPIFSYVDSGLSSGGRKK